MKRIILPVICIVIGGSLKFLCMRRFNTLAEVYFTEERREALLKQT